jgi:response regulator RpfG family c-di-GMP phosphodiesterase
MEISYVFQRIRQLAGVRYDPAVVEALVQSYEKGDLIPAESEPSSRERPLAAQAGGASR